MARRGWNAVLVLWSGGAAAALLLGLLGFLWFPLDILAHFRVQFIALASIGVVAALLTCRWRIAGIGSLVVLGALASLGPAWREAPAKAAAGCEASPLRVAVANLLYHNVMPDAATDGLLALDADVLATLETTPRFSGARSRLHARYRHVSLTPGRDSRLFYAVLWSKRPLLDARDGGGGDDAPDFALGEIVLAEGVRVVVAGLHFSWPLLRQEPQLEGLPRLFDGAPPLRIVMGDFNAAPWSEALRRAEIASATRLIDGLRLSWSGSVPPGVPMPPGLPLDHILVSDGIGVDRIEAVTLHGSDHKAIVADLRVPLCGK